jgi:hypothetical protein
MLRMVFEVVMVLAVVIGLWMMMKVGARENKMNDDDKGNHST